MGGGRGGKTTDVPEEAAKEKDAATSPLMALGGWKGRADPLRCGDRSGDSGAVGAQASGCGVGLDIKRRGGDRHPPPAADRKSVV